MHPIFLLTFSKKTLSALNHWSIVLSFMWVITRSKGRFSIIRFKQVLPART